MSCRQRATQVSIRRDISTRELGVYYSPNTGEFTRRMKVYLMESRQQLFRTVDLEEYSVTAIQHVALEVPKWREY